jgi:hypothetical protein
MKFSSGARTTITCVCLWLVLGAVLRVGAQNLGPNLVQNGSFGALDGWTIYGYMWSPQAGGADGGGYIAFQQFAYQTIPTQPGATYLLQFWTQSDFPLIQVDWGSEHLGLFPQTSGLQGWTLNELDVTAQATSTNLRFSDGLPDNPWAFCYLDEVAVHLVPEPSAITLILSGAGFLLAVCFRRYSTVARTSR